MSPATLVEIEDRLKILSDSDLQKVLALLRDLTEPERPLTATGADFIESLPPPLSDEAAREMQEAIEEGCEYPPLGESGISFLRSLPRFTPEEVSAMAKAIEEGCEQVNPDEW